ncbi:hypothetical protein HA402_007428 [Bradysia odoriphaga]|nr:hypothetical protein HA402_007428 [Bradysia odoriphaga]
MGVADLDVQELMGVADLKEPEPELDNKDMNSQLDKKHMGPQDKMVEVLDVHKEMDTIVDNVLVDHKILFLENHPSHCLYHNALQGLSVQSKTNIRIIFQFIINYFIPYLCYSQHNSYDRKHLSRLSINRLLEICC